MAYLGSKPSQTLATPTSQYFNGDGSTVAFTLNRPVNVSEDLEVFVNNIQQEPGVGKSYTATGTTLTFDAAPSSGTANVYVVYRGLAEVTTRLEHDPNAALAATTGTFSGDLTVDTNTLYVDSTNNRVGVGTTSPSSLLHLSSGASSAQGIKIENSSGSTNGDAILQFTTPSLTTTIGIDATSTDLFKISNSSALGTSDVVTIGSSGHLIVGHDGSGSAYFNEGIVLNPAGDSVFHRDGNSVVDFSRETSDGNIVRFVKDNSVVGSIGVGNGSSYAYIGTGDTGIMFNSGNDFIQPWNPSTNGSKDNGIDLGNAGNRFKNLYLSGGAYLGGTGSANKLDDYEEGTITDLRIYFDTNLSATGATGSSYVTATGGIYTKIGRLVTVQFYWSGTYDANQVLLKHMENLPFVVGSSNNGFYGGNTSIPYHRGFSGYYRYNTSTDLSNNINLIASPGTTTARFTSWAHSFTSTGFPLMNAGSGQELSASLTYMTS
jgi:hypothetical protein